METTSNDSVNFWEMPWEVLDYWFSRRFPDFARVGNEWRLKALSAEKLPLNEICGRGLKIEDGRICLDLPLDGSNLAYEARLRDLSERLAGFAGYFSARIEDRQADMDSLRARERDLLNRFICLNMELSRRLSEMEERIEKLGE